MRQMIRGVLLLILLAGATVAARAGVTPVDLSSTANDFRIILNGSPCGADICVALNYTGPSMFIDEPFFFPPDAADLTEPNANPPLFFAAVNFPFPTPVIPAQSVTCGSDVFQCTPLVFPFSDNPANYFWGVWFYDGTLESGHTYEIGETGFPGLQLTLPPDFTCATCQGDTIAFTPELPTSALFGTGLLLILGGAVWRRRLGSHLGSRVKPAITATEA